MTRISLHYTLRRISAASSASARLSQKVEAAVTPDPTKGRGRCSPERGCHEVTGVESIIRTTKKARSKTGLFCVRMIGLEPTCREALAPETSVSTISPHPLFRKVGQRYKMFLKYELFTTFSDQMTMSNLCSPSHPFILKTICVTAKSSSI